MTRGAKIVALAMVCGFAVSSCTETSLYSPSLPRKEADRIALSGRVCTEDPVDAQFPTRVILLVDQAAGPLFDSYDAGSQRMQPMLDFVRDTIGSPTAALAVVGYGGQPRKLAPNEGDFTRDTGQLNNAVAQLTLPRSCLAGNRCRDYREALRSARTLIEGDLARLPEGLLVLTQYVVIMVNAGPQQPAADAMACCPEDDATCTAVDCERQLAQAEVEQMREAVAEAGAAGMRFHTIQLAAEPDAMVNDEVQEIMRAMAFTGGGTFQRLDDIGGFGFENLDLLDLRTVLTAKLLLASNVNAKPGPLGPVVDSDGDGLSDQEEEAGGTDPALADSDLDGISDLVEILVGQPPKVPDTPKACDDLDDPGLDQDLDGLSDCDEELLGTSPTLVDSDGDGMPDRLEVVSGTDYVSRDAERDEDGDGVSNGDELLQHTDPRSTDTRAHLSAGYRYELEDEGFVTELFASRPRLVTGVEIAAVSDGTTPGLGVLTFTPDHPELGAALQWQDAGDAKPGEPVAVGQGGAGVVRVPSSSFAPVQGADGRYVEVKVSLADLPPSGVSEQIRVIYRQRQCLQYTIRNIRMMATLARPDTGQPAGHNDIRLYFAQAPEGRIEVPGPYRMAQIPVIFDPPVTREPDDAILAVGDEEFVRPRLVIED